MKIKTNKSKKNKKKSKTKKIKRGGNLLKLIKKTVYRRRTK